MTPHPLEVPEDLALAAAETVAAVIPTVGVDEVDVRWGDRADGLALVATVRLSRREMAELAIVREWTLRGGELSAEVLLRPLIADEEYRLLVRIRERTDSPRPPLRVVLLGRAD